MTNIILCGGKVTRFWPLIRTLMSKQFVKLFEGESFFQKTVTVNQKACKSQIIIFNDEQYFLTVDQMEELGTSRSNYIFFPEIMNSVKVLKSKFS